MLIFWAQKQRSIVCRCSVVPLLLCALAICPLQNLVVVVSSFLRVYTYQRIVCPVAAAFLSVVQSYVVLIFVRWHTAESAMLNCEVF